MKTLSLKQVVELIDTDPSYGDGLRQPPRKIRRAEALAVMNDVFRGCDDADRTIPAAAASIGKAVACGAGCEGKCCEALVLITQTEALAIAEHLDSEHMADQREALLPKLADWQARCGDRASLAAGALSAGDHERYMTLVREHGLEHVMCPFNDAGRCAVHPARPLKCRQVWVVDTWAHCGASADPEQPDAHVVSHRAFDEFHERMQRIVSGLQVALGAGIARRPLATAVLQARKS